MIESIASEALKASREDPLVEWINTPTLPALVKLAEKLQKSDFFHNLLLRYSIELRSYSFGPDPVIIRVHFPYKREYKDAVHVICVEPHGFPTYEAFEKYCIACIKQATYAYDMGLGIFTDPPWDECS
jgi:hypothetical protein